MTVKKSQK